MIVQKYSASSKNDIAVYKQLLICKELSCKFCFMLAT